MTAFLKSIWSYSLPINNLDSINKFGSKIDDSYILGAMDSGHVALRPVSNCLI